MTVKLMSLSRNIDNLQTRDVWNTYNRWPDMKVISEQGTKKDFLTGSHPISLADPRPRAEQTEWFLPYPQQAVSKMNSDQRQLPRHPKRLAYSNRVEK